MITVNSDTPYLGISFAEVLDIDTIQNLREGFGMMGMRFECNKPFKWRKSIKYSLQEKIVIKANSVITMRHRANRPLRAAGGSWMTAGD